MRKTKIVCTMGPNTDNKDIMEALVKNGMNVATKETISTPILHENIKALKELMTAIQTTLWRLWLKMG